MADVQQRPDSCVSAGVHSRLRDAEGQTELQRRKWEAAAAPIATWSSYRWGAIALCSNEGNRFERRIRIFYSQQKRNQGKAPDFPATPPPGTRSAFSYFAPRSSALLGRHYEY
ncbi:hypothetical protein GHK63_21525 [Sinorhizobium meliloti]|nr:hypothetical protein [Sinorhizobium meliloti]